jgi:3-oxoacyl-[acyl-carrier protein] reductase
MDLDLKGKVALITGSSHGIGQSIAQLLSKEGCDLALCSRNQRYDMNSVKNNVEANGVLCYTAEVDVFDDKQLMKFVEGTLGTYGRIDILINNVGGGNSWGSPPCFRTYLDVMTINYGVTVQLTNYVADDMLKRNVHGRIVTIASVYGKESGGHAWFQAAKSAQISYMKSMSRNKKYAEAGITFNTICPGFLSMSDKKIDDFYKSEIPGGQFGTPDDVAPMVALLCSPKSSYINGACITIDGGFSKSF